MGSILDSSEKIRKRKKGPSRQAYKEKEKLEKKQDSGIMAKKEEEGPKVVLEREYNVPLRREFQKSPNWKKTKKAVKALKEFLQKHMKSDDVKLGRYLNEELWKHGMKNPPHHVKVIAKKEDNGVVTAELEGAPVKEEEKGKEPVKGEEKKEEKAEAVKAEEKKAAPEAKEKVVVEKEKEPEPKKEEKVVEEKPKEKPAEPKKPQQKPEAEKEEKPASKKEPDVKEVEELAKDIVRKESLK